MKALTIAQARATLAPLGVTLRKTPYDEYCVRLKGSPAGHGYFTTDLQDALDTGLAMAREQAQRHNDSMEPTHLSKMPFNV